MAWVLVEGFMSEIDMLTESPIQSRCRHVMFLRNMTWTANKRSLKGRKQAFKRLQF